MSLGGALAGALLATGSSAQTAAEYPVHLNFGGLIAVVPKPAVKTSAPVMASQAPLAEFWVLAVRGEERAELVAAAARARNGSALPTAPPNKLHHAFMRVKARDLLRGSCPDAEATACAALIANVPDARVQLALGAADPFAPDAGRRARYDIFLEADRVKGTGVTAKGLDIVDGIPAGTNVYAQACQGCAAFAPDAPVRYAKPESGVADFDVPLGFRIGFRDGEHINVDDDMTMVTMDRVTGVTRIRLIARDTGNSQHTIALKPAAGSPLEIDILNVPPEQLMDAPADGEEVGRAEALRRCLARPRRRLTHLRLLYLLAPRPSAKYAYDYTDYDAPIDPRQARWCDSVTRLGPHMKPLFFHIDPFCTKPRQLVSRD